MNRNDTGIDTRVMSASKFGSGVPLGAVLGGGFNTHKELVPYISLQVT